MRRGGSDLTYALVDFELLQRTPEHQSAYKEMRREWFHRVWSNGRKQSDGPIPTHLKRATVFGVDFVFGRPQEGGQLWVVGQNPDLFDYFVELVWHASSDF